MRPLLLLAKNLADRRLWQRSLRGPGNYRRRYRIALAAARLLAAAVEVVTLGSIHWKGDIVTAMKWAVDDKVCTPGESWSS
jgi:glycogen synthase